MAWLRIDDGFAFHPKVVQLTRAERWTWLEILCYCARYKTDGELPFGISEAVPKATGAFLEKCASIGLLDETIDCYTVHDWREFNPKDPTATERKRKERSLKGHADVTEVTVTETVTERDSRVAARARSRPVPSPVAVTSSSTKDPGDELAALAGSEKQLTRWRAAQSLDPERVDACLTEAKAKGSNVGAYLDTLIANGSHPKLPVTLAAGAQGTRSTAPKPKFVCECGVGFNSEPAYEDHLGNVHGVVRA